MRNVFSSSTSVWRHFYSFALLIFKKTSDSIEILKSNQQSNLESMILRCRGVKNFATLLIVVGSCTCLVTACSDNTVKLKGMSEETSSVKYGGYDSPQKFGEHLVTIAGCHDCHSPKKMTPQGMEFDSSRLLSGHPSDMAEPDVNRGEMQRKGYLVTQDLTSWVGPWGVSYTANLTSDSTGIGAWHEEQFFTAIREGKFKGLRNGRNLLPPMPWDVYRKMSDEELRAIFAYLKSTKPIKNVVPAPKPPASM